jgi:hypothetical protein
MRLAGAGILLIIAIGFESLALISLVPLFAFVTDGDTFGHNDSGLFEVLENFLDAIGIGLSTTSIMAAIAILFLLKTGITFASDLTQFTSSTSMRGEQEIGSSRVSSCPTGATFRINCPVVC